MEKEPEPDYNDTDEQDGKIEDVLNAQLKDGLQQKERSPSMSSDDGLIGPRKLKNPCIESQERQALHKELLLNYKRYGLTLFQTTHFTLFQTERVCTRQFQIC